MGAGDLGMFPIPECPSRPQDPGKAEGGARDLMEVALGGRIETLVGWITRPAAPVGQTTRQVMWTDVQPSGDPIGWRLASEVTAVQPLLARLRGRLDSPRQKIRGEISVRFSSLIDGIASRLCGTRRSVDDVGGRVLKLILGIALDAACA